jgi:hypothetical protein
VVHVALFYYFDYIDAVSLTTPMEDKMLGLWFVSALTLACFGTSVNNGSLELNKNPPFVHVIEEKAVIEYTYPTGRDH